MDYNIDNTIIVVISVTEAPEKKFLSKCNNFDGIRWEFAVTDGSNYKLDSDENVDLKFVLINQCEWKNDSVKSIISKINRIKDKHVIAWTHQAARRRCPAVDCGELKNKLMKMQRCNSFHHTPGYGFDKEMSGLSEPENFAVSFQNLIYDALGKKDKAYLYAFSILCMVFLAIYAEKHKFKNAIYKNMNSKKIICDTLARMGWFNLKDKSKTEILRSNLDEKFGDISSMVWWDIFKREIDDNTLKSKIEDECKGKIPSAIEALVDLIYENKVKAEQVSAAYWAILNELGGETCVEK